MKEKEKLCKSINGHFSDIAKTEALRNLTTWEIGGDAVVAEPRSYEEVSDLLRFFSLQKISWRVLGSGSNVLASDEGCDEVIIHLPSKSANTTWRRRDNGWNVVVDTGVLLPSLAQDACRKGAAGFVFAVGIPGTLGGGVFMNAGAYGSSMADIVLRVWAVLPDGTDAIYTNDECGFSYRSSRFQDEESVITRVELKLSLASPDELKKKAVEILNLRQEKFPLDLPNAGSVFKRPEEDIPPGKLIEDCGLKGVSVGNAEVSRKHANFIVNNGNATAANVVELIGIVKETVFEKTGILLKEEVRYLGNMDS